MQLWVFEIHENIDIPDMFFFFETVVENLGFYARSFQQYKSTCVKSKLIHMKHVTWSITALPVNQLSI